jgi:hypothetical protein
MVAACLAQLNLTVVVLTTGLFGETTDYIA